MEIRSCVTDPVRAIARRSACVTKADMNPRDPGTSLRDPGRASSRQNSAEVARLFRIRGLQVERRRQIGKAFAHPLVAIRIPADRVSPPRVPNFVRRDGIPVAGVSC